jgi:hypothetical protein
VELEDAPAVGRCHRIIEIHSVDDPNELKTEPEASRER